MSKTKTPFFGLEAHGSVGGSITAQALPNATLVRRKPLPTYRYTLPQAYQRWTYRDYAYLWTLQTLATKQEYASAGVPHHLTGFQYWMSQMLETLPDLSAWWKLDDNLGATTVDTSRNANTATVLGASPADGLIGRAFSFDGLNDRLHVPDHPSLRAPETIALIFYSQNLVGNRTLISKYQYALNKREYHLTTIGNKLYYAMSLDGTGATVTNLVSTTNLVTLTWYSVIATWDGTNMHLYINGHKDATVQPFAGPIFQSDSPVTIGTLFDIYRYWGIIDNVILKNRFTDSVEAIRHTERSYPRQ